MGIAIVDRWFWDREADKILSAYNTESKDTHLVVRVFIKSSSLVHSLHVL